MSCRTFDIAAEVKKTVQAQDNHERREEEKTADQLDVLSACFFVIRTK